MGTFFSTTTMKRTGDTSKIAVIGDLETGQKRNILPEYFPPNEKSGKWNKTADGHHEEVSSGKTAWTLNEIEIGCQGFLTFNPNQYYLHLKLLILYRIKHRLKSQSGKGQFGPSFGVDFRQA